MHGEKGSCRRIFDYILTTGAAWVGAGIETDGTERMAVVRWLVGAVSATFFNAGVAHAAEHYYAINLTKDSMSAVNFDTVKMGLNGLRYATYTLVLAVPMSLQSGKYAQIVEQDEEVNCVLNTSKALSMRTYSIQGEQLTLNIASNMIESIEPGTYAGVEESLVCNGTPPPNENPTTLEALKHRYFDMLEHDPAMSRK